MEREGLGACQCLLIGDWKNYFEVFCYNVYIQALKSWKRQALLPSFTASYMCDCSQEANAENWQHNTAKFIAHVLDDLHVYTFHNGGHQLELPYCPALG